MTLLYLSRCPFPLVLAARNMLKMVGGLLARGLAVLSMANAQRQEARRSWQMAYIEQDVVLP